MESTNQRIAIVAAIVAIAAAVISIASESVEPVFGMIVLTFVGGGIIGAALQGFIELVISIISFSMEEDYAPEPAKAA